eukprot:1292017-Prymnesium_polylepis.1
MRRSYPKGTPAKRRSRCQRITTPRGRRCGHATLTGLSSAALGAVARTRGSVRRGRAGRDPRARLGAQRGRQGATRAVPPLT